MRASNRQADDKQRLHAFGDLTGLDQEELALIAEDRGCRWKLSLNASAFNNC